MTEEIVYSPREIQKAIREVVSVPGKTHKKRMIETLAIDRGLPEEIVEREFEEMQDEGTIAVFQMDGGEVTADAE